MSIALGLGCTGPQSPHAAGPGGSGAPDHGTAGSGSLESHDLSSPTAGATTSPARSLVVLDTDTLRLEATPAVPAAMRDRMNQYLNTRSAGLNDLSPDGSRVLIATRFGETSQVHLVRSPMGARTQVTFADEPASGARFDPRDPGAVLYSADKGGDEQHQIYRLDLKTGKKILLTDPEARNSAALWSHDGSFIAYSSNSRNKRDFDVWISNGRDPASATRVVDGKGWWAPADWSWDGKKLLVSEYISANQARVHVADVATKQVSPLSPEGMAFYGSAVFGKDGKTVYVASDREGEFRELYETNTTGSTWRSLTRAIPWDVTGTALSPDGRTLAFTVNQGGYSTLYLLDTRTRKYRRVEDVPKGLISGSGMRFAAKGNVLGFSFSSATRSGDVYTYDLKRRKLSRWTESEMGGLSSDNLIEPTLVEYASFDGRAIPAFYYRPKGAGPFPVLINIHGGPEGQALPYFLPLAQYAVAEAGMAVIFPNVRGSAGYGKTYLTLDNGERREDSVKDIGALLDWIETQPELDGKRVGVLGGSYGGYMVLAALTHFGDRITAGVDVVGISNFVTFLENTAEYRRDLRRVEYGDERDPKMREHLLKISPTNNVHKIKSALFVAQGANDPRVPASEAEQIVKAVRSAGHDVWYMLAKNEGHGFAKKENRDLYYLLTLMFFDKHLGATR
jgi:dipeptidyl aminopeptidase/acylaminoacyl peptidase